MKKIYLSFLACLSFGLFSAQTNLVIEAPLNNNTQNANRAPNGTSLHTYYSSCFLVKQNELTNMTSGTSITSFGYTLGTAASAAVTGNFTVYLQNTTDATYQKGTAFATALTGMSSVYANVMTVPSAGATSVIVTLSTPFAYTGGGLYVACNWNATGPFNSAAALYLGESAAMPLPGGGGAVGFSSTGAPGTLTLTGSRPSFLFGFTNSNTNDMEVETILAPGKVPAMLNSPHLVSALVRNLSTITLNNIPVTLTVGGANVFADTQTITSLPAGATSIVSFNAFNPATPGVNTLSVTVPSDQNNLNNLMTYTQQVTCNEWSQNPALGTYTANQVGFNTGAGILSTAFNNPVASTLIAIRAAISSNTPSIGRSVYGVLQSNTGAVIATTNTITLTSGMLGTFITFTFSTPQNLASGTTYNFGMAQTAATPGYHPYGTLGAHYLPTYYAYTGISGGTYVILTQNFGYFGIEGVFKPNITLTVAPQSVSCGNTATINAFSSTNYSWSTGATSSSIVVSPTVSTAYTVVATNTLGCSVSTVALLTVTPLSVTVSSSPTVICLGDPVNISANGGVTYTWSTGSNASSFSDTPTVTTTYTVTADNQAGCTGTGSVLVSVQSFSNLTVSPLTTTVCVGTPVSFTAGSASTYTWLTGTGTSNTASITATPSVSSVYTVTGANPLGCSMSRTVNITVNSTSLTTTPDTAICKGSTIVLTASGASSYVWNSTYSFSSLPASPSVNTVYYVSGIGANNCTGTASITVSVNENPTVTATAGRTIMCRYEKNTIKATGANSYSWSNAASGASIVITPTNTLPQNITVTGTDQNGCSGTATVKITVNTCTGIEEAEPGTAVRVYPNPNNGKIFIEVAEPANKVIGVYNLLGECLATTPVTSGIMEMSLQSLPNAVYLIRLSEGAATIRIVKIIKE